MSIDFERFCADKGIEHNCGKEWIQLRCPLCGDHGKHLGYNPSWDVFNCWRCGRHYTIEIIAALLSCSAQLASQIIREYRTETPTESEFEVAPKIATVVRMPTGCGPMKKIHRDYLRSRNFDPYKLADTWGLQGTGPLGNYKLRIIAPIVYRRILVSYQGRDITNKSPARYKACRMEDEVIHHKHIVYGFDHVPGDSVVIVEGITHVWKLGFGAVATFGCEWSQEQLNILRKFKRRFIAFDNDVTSLSHADNLAEALALFGGRTEVLKLNTDDIAHMSDKQAKKLMKELHIRK